ncbi:hypothetical protein POTOM_043833 [Populus tomentosa]|uniref:Transmembrane protein n=1 Tax=Populus tomentosa TaxID=118781 RepID=A0A8X7YJ37_POPTO|nr:hypothetical protein POTOM_043833 [Populus tomentosa]
MASNLNTLPEPLGLVIEEFAAAGGGGGGGNLGFWKGFGGGRFDGWGRKGKMNSGFLGFLVVSGLGLILFLFGGELKIDVVSGVLVLSLLGAVLVKGFKRGIKDWILGLCFFGVLLGLGLKKGEMQKWVERCRVRSPVLVLMKGKRRHGRRICNDSLCTKRLVVDDNAMERVGSGQGGSGRQFQKAMYGYAEKALGILKRMEEMIVTPEEVTSWSFILTHRANIARLMRV